MTEPHTTLLGVAKFYAGWGLALAAASGEPVAHTRAIPTLAFHGIDLPVVQLALAVAGVLMARPLAPRRSGERGPWRQVLVTLIMLVLATTWAFESRPGLLFTFVVSIGLGFSGYALIELAGKEIEGSVRSIFARVADSITSIGSGPK